MLDEADEIKEREREKISVERHRSRMVDVFIWVLATLAAAEVIGLYLAGRRRHY